MTDTVRCPACRGAKKVAKLGGIVGECNTCKGEGTILASDKPKPVVSVVEPVINEVIKAVADCVPVSTVTIKEDLKLPDSDKVVVDSIDIKVDPKKALYKRKTVAK